MVVDCLLPMAKTRQKPDLLQGTLDLLILRTLQWGPQHGHGIGVALRASSDEVLNIDHGSLYPALHRLERPGLGRRGPGRPAIATSGRSTTGSPPAGRRQLTVERSRWTPAVGGDRARARAGNPALRRGRGRPDHGRI